MSVGNIFFIAHADPSLGSATLLSKVNKTKNSRDDSHEGKNQKYRLSVCCFLVVHDLFLVYLLYEISLI